MFGIVSPNRLFRLGQGNRNRGERSNSEVWRTAGADAEVLGRDENRWRMTRGALITTAQPG